MEQTAKYGNINTKQTSTALETLKILQENFRPLATQYH